MAGFDTFLQERQYLLNVSPHTLRWYKHALKWLPSETPTDSDLKAMVISMRERGLKPTGCNAACRAINCYLHWSGSALKVPRMKEPEFIPPTFSQAQVSRLVSYRPRLRWDRRAHLLSLVLLDTGCRISEALAITWQDVDWDNLLLTLHGKGRRDRLVPMSLELRKALWRQRGEGLVFTLGRCAALRSMKSLCRLAGFEPPPRTLHAFRHSFALHYLRRGGSVFHLQKVLGHSSLEMTRRYASLNTGDLQAVHQRLSLLVAN